ncbi:MAG: helix-hairpin-helix domain-containing protein [Candidatus Cloacimonetes bacterium]|nr:helix-hairpin-helix domain-containing protein [Candidatus Cloacimonadota bacterium]
MKIHALLVWLFILITVAAVAEANEGLNSSNSAELTELPTSISSPDVANRTHCGGCGTADIPQAPDPINLNEATLDDLRGLPISEQQAHDIWQYRTYIAWFESVYDLREIPSIDQQTLLRLKPLVTVTHDYGRDETDRRRDEIFFLIERLGSSEGQQEGIADVWEDYLLTPRNVNRLTMAEIHNMPQVSPIDATAVARRLAQEDSIADWRDLRNTSGIAYYGARNLRNYIYCHERTPTQRLFVDYQLKYYDGLRDDEIDGVIVQPRNDRAPTVMNKLRMRLGNRWKAGLMHNARKGERNLFEQSLADLPADLKFYLGYENYLPFDGEGYLKVYGGNYRATFGEGLVMENTDFFSARKTGMGFSKRITGIIGDVSRTQEYSLRGAAAEWRSDRFNLALFGSVDDKDAVLYDTDGDGVFGSEGDEVFSYITMGERVEEEEVLSVAGEKLAPVRDALRETLVGAHFEYSPILGTHVGVTAYNAAYDRDFYIPDTIEGITPFVVRKSSDYDKIKLNDGEIAALASCGDNRRVYGFDWRTVVSNVSWQGEYAEMADGGNMAKLGDDPSAILTSAFVQYENFHFMAMFRDYDLDFDNPYSRAFSEASKLEDTILEKDYYLTNPALIDLYNNGAQAQAERGFYFETRYQFHRQFTLTHAYIDMWERKSDGRRSLRFQGELEYRPIFPLRLRLKHKHQVKRTEDWADRGKSTTDESTFLVRMFLSRRDQLELEYRYSQVKMPPYTNLSDDADPIEEWEFNSFVGAQSLIHGDFLAVNYTHNFHPGLRVRGGILYWNGHGVSHWDWEDMEIDFMGDEGIKFWFTVHDRISSNLYLTLKYRVKRYRTREIDIRDYNVDETEPVFANRVENTEQAIRLQLDWKF